MSRNTFLTSGLILGLAISPAIADDTLYKDMNIGSSCTADFLGSDSGNAVNSFLAQYTPNDYPVNAGSYLPARAIEGVQCPANSWCAGGTFTFSEDNNQGMENCPSDYSLSAAGTSSADACYHNCTASDIVNGAKVATIKGGTVTKGGVNTCDAICTTGYTFKAASGGTNPLSGKENIATGEEAFISYGLNNEYCVGTSGGGAKWFGVDYGGSCSDIQFSGMSAGDWSTTFSHGTIKGEALCSTQSGTGAWNGASNASQVSTADSLTPETGTGQYCWCKITGYTPSGSSTLQSLSSPWVFSRDDGDFCAHYCASDCATLVRDTDSDDLVFRAALLGSVGATSEPAACVANEITVSWNQANGQGSVTNTCTYDGDITLPTAPTKTGYTFSGWKLVTSSSSN